MSKYPDLETQPGDVLVVYKSGVGVIEVGPVHTAGGLLTTDRHLFTNTAEAVARAKQLVLPGRRIIRLDAQDGSWIEILGSDQT